MLLFGSEEDHHQTLVIGNMDGRKPLALHRQLKEVQCVVMYESNAIGVADARIGSDMDAGRGVQAITAEVF